MRRLVAIGVLALAATACNGGDDEAASATTDRPATTVATTTTTVATTTTTEVVPFDIEVRRAAIALLEVRNQVFMSPDVARVGDYIAESCTCLERERGFIERFVSEDLRWTDRMIQIRGISLIADDAAAPEVAIVAHQPTADLVSADGRVVEHVEATDAATFSITLFRLPTGEWRVNGLESISLNADVIASIVGEGTP